MSTAKLERRGEEDRKGEERERGKRKGERKREQGGRKGKEGRRQVASYSYMQVARNLTSFMVWRSMGNLMTL